MDQVARLLFALALVVVAGCGKRDCLSLISSNEFSKAVEVCEYEFKNRRSVRTQMAAVQSAAMVENYDLVDQILDSQEPQPAGSVWLVAARIALQQQRSDLTAHYATAAEDLSRKSGDTFGAADALVTAAEALWYQGRHRETIEHAGEALKIVEGSGREDITHRALSRLFNAFVETGNFGLARATLDKMEQLSDVSSLETQYALGFDRGVLEVKARNFGLAKHEYEEALEAAEKLGNTNGQRYLHLNLVEANLGLGRVEVAQNHLAAANKLHDQHSQSFSHNYFEGLIKLQKGELEGSLESFLKAENLGASPSWDSSLHYHAGIAAERLGQIDIALGEYRNAVEALEKLGRNLSYDELRGQLFAEQRRPYEALFSLLMRTGSVSAAFDVVERAKNRALVDSFIANADPNEKEGNSIEATVVRVENVQQYIDSLDRLSSAQPTSDERFIKHQKDAQIVVHFVANGRLWVGWNSGEEMSFSLSDMSEEELLTLLRDYSSRPEDHKVLRTLGSELFPDEALPTRGQHLYVVPDAAFAQVALPSLRINGEFLIQRNSISLIPSVHILSLIQSREGAAGSNTVVIADPAGDLPAALREADVVSHLLGVAATVGADASSYNLGKARGVLHLATHSGQDALGPWLELADTRIRSSHIMGMPFHPALAVLATCGSGAAVGSNIWGSLGGVFLVSGSRQSVVAVWSIGDDSTVEVVRSFYQRMQQQDGAARALAGAQREAIDKGISTSIWAPFVVLGTE